MAADTERTSKKSGEVDLIRFERDKSRSDFQEVLGAYYRDNRIGIRSEEYGVPEVLILPEISVSSERARAALFRDTGTPSSFAARTLWSYEEAADRTERDIQSKRSSLMKDLVSSCDGPDRAFAEQALDCFLATLPFLDIKIVPSPENGVLFEHGWREGMLTLLIEGDIGIIVNTGEFYRENFNIEINPHSINILLERYQSELRFVKKYM
tara:strand:+ start:1001 stop:1630 length:630 start_codon:yes stop_codon:yes gene_type:complete